MLLSLRRAGAFAALTLLALFTAVGSSHAVVVVVYANAESATAPSSRAQTIVLHGGEDSDGVMTFSLLTQPSHGVATLLDDKGCTYTNGDIDCTISSVYTSTDSYVGADSYQYQVTDQAGASATATVSVNVTGTTPTLAAEASTTVGASFALSAGNLVNPGTSTVDWGDGAPAQSIDVDPATLQTTISHVYMAAGEYAIAVTNDASNGRVTTSGKVTVVVAPTPPPTPDRTPIYTTQTIAPGAPTLLSPGLRIQVVDGQIRVTTSLVNREGQAGFISTTLQTPIANPTTPGIRFTPAPSSAQPDFHGSFTLQATGTSSSMTTLNTVSSVDCVVKSLRRSARTTFIAQYIPAPIKYGPTITPTKTYCNRFRRSKGSPSSTKTPPELWFLNTRGKLQQAVSSTKTGSAGGFSPNARTLSFTFDATSTPTLASLSRTTSFAVLSRPVAKPRNALRGVAPTRAFGWPGATMIASGTVFTCPATSRQACRVQLRAVSKQFGVVRLVGNRSFHVAAGTTASLNFPLLQRGRWRLASGRLRAAIQVSATAFETKPIRERYHFPIDIPLR
ncbi:MAG: hypothetical protein JWL76_492 [Thermoleophilia bacterium]|nr:hypothetical protein [Thermoleophilia bacterium]